MNSVVILGSTGMIGSTLVKYFHELDVPIIEVNREGVGVARASGVVQFDALSDNVYKFVSNFPKSSTFINLFGVIRHKIDLESEESIKNAKLLNSFFPKELTKAVEEVNGRLIQIATDCIFSGKVGGYTEFSKADPIDLYGESKYDGECISSNLMTLRVSAIGREYRNHVELMDWVIYQEPKATLKGFENHLWNGLTTLHFAKIVASIIVKKLFTPGTFHVIPGNSISKFELVSLIARYSNRSDLTILKTRDSNTVNRTLSTEFPDFNSMIWKSAGYEFPLTIEVMVEEYFAWLLQQS